MDTVFFLAANSGRGFYSLYDGFPERRGVFLSIIKGGPGTGKSGFMRRISAAAKQSGLDTEEIICSGDPDSLDALYIPALGRAWMDGTAPHVREPKVFAADAGYEDLGRFCASPLGKADAALACEINRDYKAVYAQAYNLLAAAAQTADCAREAPLSCAGAEKISALIGEAGEPGFIKRRFLSAMSCMGRVRLAGTLRELCPHTIMLSDEGLDHAARMAVEAGLGAIICPQPLRPDRLDAVLLPERSLAFVSRAWERESTESIEAEAEENEFAALRDVLLDHACALLAKAKGMHDELERVYRPYMDFSSLTAYTDSVIHSLLD
mgnify:FL=1